VFIADDVVGAPLKWLLWVFREIEQAAAQEVTSEGEAIRAELARLYQMLEQGALGDDEFDALESELLDRLDAIEQRGLHASGDRDEDDEDDDEDDDTAADEDDGPPGASRPDTPAALADPKEMSP